MHRRRSRWVGAAVVGSALVPALATVAIGAGPVRVAIGEPDGDTRLSDLTTAQQAFVDRKLAMAATIGNRGSYGPKSSGQFVAEFTCEYDPCEGTPPSPGPGPSASPTMPPQAPQPTAQPAPPSVPAARTLATRARQQNNYYFCGPASGQIVINWSRGYTSGGLNGEDATINWRKQSKIAEWMGTTSAGTGGANLAAGLNNANAVLKPTADWIYIYADNGTSQELYGKIVTDIATYGMPLVLATAPHTSGAGVNYLESWPNAYPGAHHWIVLRGYDGLPGSGGAQVVKYQDSSAGFGGATGSFDDALSVIWQVSKWNQGGHVVW